MYFVPELYKNDVSALKTGLSIGAYQFCRCTTCMVSVPLPKSSQFICTVVAFAGYVISMFYDPANIELFIVGTVIIGFCETMPHY